MDPQLKTRLIGATIIVSLVVIFVPMLFEDSSDTTVADAEQAALPEFPKSEFDSQTLPLPSAMPTAQSSAQYEPPPMPEPVEEEALDPLDVPPSKAATGKGSASAEIAAVPEEKAEEAAPVSKPAPAVKPVPLKPALAEEPVKPAEKVHPQAPKEKEPPAKAKGQASAAAPAAKGKPAAADKKPAPAAEPPKKEAAAPQGAPRLSAWVVQAGSFSDESNAKTLMQKLRQAKIPAFVEMVPSAAGNSWRVRVGPELDRSKADAILKKMESDAGVKGMIVSYP